MYGITGLDGIVYGVNNLQEATKFFEDWGLRLKDNSPAGAVFETLEKTEVVLKASDDPSLPAPIETGPTVRQVFWGVEDDEAMARVRSVLGGAATDLEGGAISCVDPNGLSLVFRKPLRRPANAPGAQTNTLDKPARIDEPAPMYERAHPTRLSHVVFFVEDLEAHRAFYCGKLGFQITDEYDGRGMFLRCNMDGPHHDLFLLQVPGKAKGVNHVSFGLRDIYEVMGGGIYFEQCGHNTQLGPGRHPVSSAFFWYFFSPGGGLVEYYADEDFCTEKWRPRLLEPSPQTYAQWAIVGGIDPETRRQKERAPGAG